METNSIKVTCKNTNTEHYYSPGTSLWDVYNDIKPTLEANVLAVIVNNELKELAYKLYNPKIVEFIDITHPDGMRTYSRSLTFLLQVAVREVLPNFRLSVQHSVSKGLYCEITNNKLLEISDINRIESRMREMVKQDLVLEKDKIPTSEAIELFKKDGYNEKALLLETDEKFYSSVYRLNNHPDSFYGPLVYSTGALKTFGLATYYQGVLLMFPQIKNVDVLENFVIQNKMLQIFQEHKDWNQILGVKSIGNINKALQKGYATDIIQVSEALHEKKYAYIADKIKENENVKIVLISGPSSSGKTTSAKRIAVQLRVAGKRPHIIELDNYFVDRENTPRDENGDYDFESIHAVDIDLFNNQLNDLLEGKEVNIPKFDFYTGTRQYLEKDKIKMDEKDILIIEGIHGLNPELIKTIPENRVFRIYASALTSLSIDENNRIPTTDNRLIRRIVRDAATRGYSASDTISRWQSVRKGEDKNIFPYQENADIMFNSSLLYEMCVLGKYAEPLLRKVSPIQPEYVEALRLLKFLSYFKSIDLQSEKTIPPTSVLREFIGKSSFNY